MTKNPKHPKNFTFTVDRTKYHKGLGIYFPKKKTVVLNAPDEATAFADMEKLCLIHGWSLDSVIFWTEKPCG